MKSLRVISLVALVAACGSEEMVGGDAPGADGGSSDGGSSDGNSSADGSMGGLDGALNDGAPFTDGRDAVFVDPVLGAVSHFAVVAGGTVTNANVTTITGDLGVYPDPTPIGTTPPIVIGTSYLGTPEAAAGQAAMTKAYNMLANEPCETNLTGLELGGMTLRPGVYCFDSSAQITGTLTLDGTPKGDHHVWVFQVGSALTTAKSAVVKVINGGNLCDAYWKIGSSATLGTGTTFGGSIVAMASITLNTGTSVAGRVLGRTGSVTLDTNTVSIAGCPGDPGDAGDGGD